MTPPSPAGPAEPDYAHGAIDSELTMPAAKLLMTLLGDYWFGRTTPIASSALVVLLAEFGVSDDAARAALSRLCRDGRIERSRDGRRTAYRLAASARAAAADRGRALMRYGEEPIGWDGQWTCVAFSVPEPDRHRRWALRTRLREVRMGRLFDGLWISPHDVVEPIGTALDDLHIEGATILRATAARGLSGADLLEAWDLVTLRASFDSLTTVLGDLRGRLEGGAMSPAEALRVRTDLMSRWRTLAGADPYLPDALLPDDWPLGAARRQLVAVYDALGPLGEQRVRQLVGDPADEGPRHHPLAEW